MFPNPISVHRIEEHNLNINKFNSINSENKKIRFTVTQEKSVLMRLVVTDNVIFPLLMPKQLRQNIPSVYLISVILHLRDTYGYKFDDDVFLRSNYFPIHFKFQNYLVANYDNCDFISCDDKTFINLDSPLIEKVSKVEIRKQRLNFIEPELSELKIYQHQLTFLIDNDYFDFIQCTYEFYSKNIHFKNHFKRILKSFIKIKFEYLIILLKLEPNLFKEFNKEEAKSLNKVRKIARDNLINLKFLMLHKIPDYDFILLRWICLNGDKETLDLYYNNYSSISFYDESDFDCFEFALSRLKTNSNISNPESEYNRFNSLKSLIFTSK